jgi:hypothetical protein
VASVGIGTTAIAFAVKAVLGLRPSEDVELAGLDLAEHGEEGYHAEGFASAHSIPADLETDPSLNVSAVRRTPATT